MAAEGDPAAAPECSRVAQLPAEYTERGREEGRERAHGHRAERLEREEPITQQPPDAILVERSGGGTVAPHASAEGHSGPSGAGPDCPADGDSDECGLCMSRRDADDEVDSFMQESSEEEIDVFLTDFAEEETLSSDVRGDPRFMQESSEEEGIASEDSGCAIDDFGDSPNELVGPGCEAGACESSSAGHPAPAERWSTQDPTSEAAPRPPAASAAMSSEFAGPGNVSAAAANPAPAGHLFYGPWRQGDFHLHTAPARVAGAVIEPLEGPIQRILEGCPLCRGTVRPYRTATFGPWQADPYLACEGPHRLATSCRWAGPVPEGLLARLPENLPIRRQVPNRHHPWGTCTVCGAELSVRVRGADPLRLLLPRVPTPLYLGCTAGCSYEAPFPDGPVARHRLPPALRRG